MPPDLESEPTSNVAPGREKVELFVLLGCTACGKGAVGREVARRLGAEIVSVDSMKVYRRMDIGTAKPSAAEMGDVAHHLIDVAEPSEYFSAARYVELADEAIVNIAGRGRPILAVGGTALYLKSLTQGLFEGPGADPKIRERLRQEAREHGTEALHRRLEAVDPEAARRIHPRDLRRIERALEVYLLTGTPISTLQRQWEPGKMRYRCRFIGLRRSQEDLHRRINARVRRMFEQGFVDECRRLLAEIPPPGPQARQAIGYAQVFAHLEGRISLDEAFEETKIQTRRLAKAQRTWFRGWPDIRWLDVDPDEPITRTAERVLEALEAVS